MKLHFFLNLLKIFRCRKFFIIPQNVKTDDYFCRKTITPYTGWLYKRTSLIAISSWQDNRVEHLKRMTDTRNIAHPLTDSERETLFKKSLRLSNWLFLLKLNFKNIINNFAHLGLLKDVLSSNIYFKKPIQNCKMARNWSRFIIIHTFLCSFLFSDNFRPP